VGLFIGDMDYFNDNTEETTRFSAHRELDSDAVLLEDADAMLDRRGRMGFHKTYAAVRLPERLLFGADFMARQYDSNPALIHLRKKLNKGNK